MMIRSSRDLKIAYETIGLYKELIGECACRDHAAKRIVDLKRDIRSFSHKESDRQIVKDNGDSWVVLITLPGYIRSKDEAVEYFEWREYMECPHSIYDCTGKLFTCWYKVFERNGKWMAYHCIAADV